MANTNDNVLGTLAGIVRQAYQRAHDYRDSSGELNRMKNVVKQLKGEALDCGEQPDGMPNLTLNISKAISRGVVSMIKRPFSKTNNRPFIIKPTPKAELSEEDRAQVAETVTQGLEEIAVLAEEDPTLIDEAITQLKEATDLKEQRFALLAAQKMEDKLADQLTQAGLGEAVDDFIDNLSRFPFAVLKLEHQHKRMTKWNGTNVEVVSDVVKKIVNINPFDFYPAPHARSVKDGSTTIERRRINKMDLYALRNVEGYVTSQIEEVLETYKDGWEEPIDASPENAATEENGSYGFYDALIMYGYLSGKTVVEADLKVVDLDGRETKADEKSVYAVELWLIGKYIIKAVQNTHPLQSNPYYVTSYANATDNVYGDSPVTDLYTVQRVINQIMTSLVRNLALSSGVVGEVNTKMLDVAPDESIEDFLTVPVNQMVPVKGTVGLGHAYHFHTLPNLTGNLMSLLTAFTQYCYEILGVPRVAFGQTEGMGAVGRTSAGVAMVMKQASGTIYDTLATLEKKIIAPLVQEFLLDELINGDDHSIKGDVQAYAVGLSGILEKESQSDKLNWLLQSLTSIMAIPDASGNPIIPPEAPARVLYTMFKEAGISTEGLFPDFGLADALRKDVATSTSPVSTITPDGRTGAIQSDVINNGPA